MYNTKCELRSTLGRDRDDESDESTATGLLIAKFHAKVLRREVSTGFVGRGTVSNDTSIVLMAPYFGQEIIPSAHSVVIDGVGHIVNTVSKFGKVVRITLL